MRGMCSGNVNTQTETCGLSLNIFTAFYTTIVIGGEMFVSYTIVESKYQSLHRQHSLYLKDKMFKQAC